ncbi:MAG: protein kinase [Candidatus Obscuribacter sp.]|nr:protein kinase [Candidatus Obscuribacter sp.]
MTSSPPDRDALAQQIKLAGQHPDVILDSNECTDPILGRTIADRYQPLERIGEGGMSTVYKARDLNLDRLVALKLLTPVRSQEPTALARFKQEAVAISRLEHNNIVRVIDYGVDDKLGSAPQPYLVMDLIQGQSLAQILKSDKPQSLDQSLAIFKQTLDALSHAHKMGIVHRDVKPSNIMFTADDQGKASVHVVDFGIAKLTRQDQSPTLTNTGEMFGSPLYMSPEQCLGNAIDARSDIYSLGCVLYELVEGHPPYQADNLLKVLHMHISAKPAPIANPLLSKELKIALNSVISKAMAQNPADRYKTIEDLSSDINAVANGNLSRFLNKKQQMQLWHLPFLVGWPLPARMALYGFLALLIPALCVGIMFGYLSLTRPTDAARTANEGFTKAPPYSTARLIQIDDLRLDAHSKNSNYNIGIRQNRFGRYTDFFQGMRMKSADPEYQLGPDLLWSGLPLNTPTEEDRNVMLGEITDSLEGKAANQVSDKSILSAAQKLKESGDLYRALNLYLFLLSESRPDQAIKALAEEGSGDCYLDLGLYFDAETRYKNALDQAKLLPGSNLARATLMLKLARIREAEADLTTSQKLLNDCLDDLKTADNANKLKRLTTMSDALMMQGKYKEAAQVLKQAEPKWDEKPQGGLESDPKPYLLRAKLAMALAEANETDKAIEITERLIESVAATQTTTTPPIAFAAPTLRDELLPRLYYSLACFYEKKANQTSPPGDKYSRRVMGNLGTALSLAADSLHDRLMRAIILNKMAQFSRTTDGGKTSYADQASKEAANILKGPNAYRSIRPTLLSD